VPVTHERQIERAIQLQDLGILVASLAVAHVARDRLAAVVPGLKGSVPLRDYILLFVAFVPTWAWGAERLALHRLRVVNGQLLDLLRALLFAQAWGALAIALILVAAQVSLNRSFMVVFLALSTLLLAGAKFVQRGWVRRRRGRALALLVGEGYSEAHGELERLRGRAVERLDAFDPATLRLRLKAGGVDEVVLTEKIPRDHLPLLLEACEEIGVPALVRMEKIDLDRARPRAEIVGPTLYLAYQAHEPDRPALLFKALCDRAVAAGALLLAGLPMLVIAALIRLTSPGPALFLQERGGLNARPFRMLKFRTMRVGAEAEREELLGANEMTGPVFKMTDDPRVTPIGRWLRRTSLDELPQLVNVLLGQMSLVGPRPLPLVETRRLTGVHRRRLSIKPGITGLWQVSGRNDLTFEEWMALDLQYVDHWSLGLDLAILLRTIPALMTTRGAR
jgi:exopolysaccharide biosynthesis polyprenyl glycosylphosphotransferase